MLIVNKVKKNKTQKKGKTPKVHSKFDNDFQMRLF